MRAMETHLVEVWIDDVWGGVRNEEMTLDITALTQYSGQGRCNYIEYRDDNATYREGLRTWAKSKNWNTKNDRCFERSDHIPRYVRHIVHCGRASLEIDLEIIQA